jgi:carbon-monoxide dehydrogenase medium subunit
MYAPSFDYFRARTVADAQQLLSAHPGAKLLAGGHSLLPLLKLRRNRGTIGGNIAHADPASDLPTVLVALDARIVAAGPGGERTIHADQFFTGIMTTALSEDEILVGVHLPASASGEGSAYEKFSHPASRYAVLGVAAWVSVANGTCSSARIALGGLLPNARRAGSVERALIGKALNEDAIAAAAGQVATDLGHDVMGDIYASAEYRAAMAPVFTKRALASAAARALR